MATTVADGLSGLLRSHVCSWSCRVAVIASASASSSWAAEAFVSRRASSVPRCWTNQGTSWMRPVSVPGRALAPSSTIAQVGPVMTTSSLACPGVGSVA